MTRQQLQHCFASLPPEVQERLTEKASVVREYVEKAQAVRLKLNREFPVMDSRAASVVSLVLARFL